ncbi:CrcB family protein [Streptomyces monashensis]|uniref:fluoride efflux transporter FluC n=1 Tax=Streptomyces monashensis TaxID=1678012 RepID=UPI00340ED9FE
MVITAPGSRIPPRRCARRWRQDELVLVIYGAVVGRLILGLLSGAVTVGAVSSQVQLLFGTGPCGALTTYSTVSYETLRPAAGGARFFTAADVVAGVVAGLGAAFVGVSLAQELWA